jgi:hypothetical protein
MPLGAVGSFGTNADGTEQGEYCKFCFRDGVFTEPDLSLDNMIARSVDHMTSELDLDKAQAESLAHDVIPKLKRWSRKG